MARPALNRRIVVDAVKPRAWSGFGERFDASARPVMTRVRLGARASWAPDGWPDGERDPLVAGAHAVASSSRMPREKGENRRMRTFLSVAVERPPLVGVPTK